MFDKDSFERAGNLEARAHVEKLEGKFAHMKKHINEETLKKIIAKVYKSAN